MNEVKVIECPRDAMQGWKTNVPTPVKIEYINQLLRVGFDTIDFGSFVSSKMVPQMADTAQVISALNPVTRKTKLLAIIANVRGAMEALRFPAISYLGFPFSASPTFQKRNINSTVNDSLERVKQIQSLCEKSNKKQVVYISMAFGNPYGDEYNEEIILHWVEKLVDENIQIISLSDTVGVAEPSQIASLVKIVRQSFPQIETGVHLHSIRESWREKIDAALENGCRRFDGALHGIGGCPMARDKLLGNMDTLLIIQYLKSKGFLQQIDDQELENAALMASQIFS